ncbi:MAG TPA: class I adenylate-forming enzyme family protein [Pseudonocardia sp.]|jgi:non-ribosomal peptide synthetase component E (peptide arylation enzyme)
MPITDHIGPATRRRWAADGLYDDLDLYTAFHRQARQRPGQLAIIDARSATTYAELLIMANRLANLLDNVGVAPGEIVAVQLPNRAVSCALDYAIAAVGAITLPIPTYYGREDLRSLLRRSGAAALVTVERFRGTDHLDIVKSLRTDLPGLRLVLSVDGGTGVIRADDALAGASPDDWRPRPIDPDGPVRISVTSGTESFPKMVVNSHNAIGLPYQRLWGDCGIGAGTRVLLGPPLGSGMGQIVTAALLGRLGATVALTDAFSPRAALRLTAHARPSHWWVVPTMVQLMLNHQDFATTDISCVHTVICAGSPVPANLVRTLHHEHGLCCTPMYGFVDGGLCSTRVDDDLDTRANTVGRPNLSVNEMRIVDDAGRPVRPGTVGEILSRGPFAPLCYLNAPELDERYRMPDGWIRSGDLGVFDDEGRLSVVGRVKDIVVRGGLNISPAEIEELLTGHPDVVQAACVGYPDALMGERVCAFLVLRLGAEAPTVASIGTYLVATGLAKTKLPERIEIAGELPTNATGKILKRVLRDRLANPVTSPTG